MCVKLSHKTQIKIFFFKKMDKCADEHKFYFLYITEQIDFQCHAVLSEISERAFRHFHGCKWLCIKEDDGIHET